MSLRQYTVTMTGAAVQANTVTNAATNTIHQPVRFVRIENDVGNALVKYGTSLVSATAYAGSVPANTATINNAVTLGPFNAMPFNLDDLWLIGTNSQTVHLTVIT